MYDFGEAVVADRVAAGWLVSDARAVGFDHAVDVVLEAEVWRRDSTGGWSHSRRELLPAALNIEFVPTSLSRSQLDTATLSR